MVESFRGRQDFVTKRDARRTQFWAAASSRIRIEISGETTGCASSLRKQSIVRDCPIRRDMLNSRMTPAQSTFRAQRKSLARTRAALPNLSGCPRRRTQHTGSHCAWLPPPQPQTHNPRFLHRLQLFFIDSRRGPKKETPAHRNHDGYSRLSISFSISPCPPPDKMALQAPMPTYQSTIG